MRLERSDLYDRCVPTPDLCPDVDLERGSEIGAKLQKIVKDTPGCVGLAAPQIGILARVFAAQVDDSGEVKFYINPVVTGIGELGALDHTEGCFSVGRGCVYRVYRYFDVRIESLNHDPETHSGFAAAVIQHETDHLNGVMISNRGSLVVSARAVPKVGRNEPCPCGSGAKLKKCCLPGLWAESVGLRSLSLPSSP